MKRIGMSFLSIISTLSVIILAAVLICGLVGLRPYILQTASMEPQYREGSLCLIDTSVSTDELSPGDPVVYRQDRQITMHRLISSEEADDGIMATLKGDANAESQSVMLNKSNLVGREVFSIPYLGNGITTLMDHRVIVYVICGLLILAAAMCRPRSNPTPVVGEKVEMEVQ